MPDMQLLKAKLKYNNLTFEKAGEILGVNRDTFAKKIASNGRNFTVGQILCLMNSIPLSKEDVERIFF